MSEFEQRGTETGRFDSSKPGFSSLPDLAKLAGQADTPELRAKILADVEEAVKAVFSRLEFREPGGRPREQRRGELAEVFFQQLPKSGVRLGAAAAAAYLFEPFLFGITGDFDPRGYLGDTPDRVLEALCERFAWGDGFASQMAWYERLRRQGKIADWSFERRSETAADVKIRPNQPAEIIEVRFAAAEGGEIVE